ncbi:BZ3500_MvSof-1268-A1-R1_Chr8-1g09955 [Microbotryum saponariae]|uniref:BZ3500_MvSof-1268-A1-R1_Chr8-1g09955 protein n=1 Tax=Microbotryum saponariae TaxID=289078 RepID=A0A2X0LM71_9BASI|nr:BZ3500_MvSof-1268-A1-R1_Chr8-1g09955 [Microbotryum saponariae]SDA08241.1 BZ3501_MvSof-1269-A2-R1_Chr8-1g09678 [Microbotryum saponariae]
MTSRSKACARKTFSMFRRCQVPTQTPKKMLSSVSHKKRAFILPRVFSKVGLVPGVLMLIFVSAMTTWSAYVVGTFKLRHPEVHSIADAGYILGGHIGQEVLGVVYTFYMLSVCAGGLLGFSTALNAVSNHSACTVWFVLVSAVITYIFAIIRTIGKLSFLGWIGVASSLIAVTTTAIVIALQNKPSASRHTDYGLATFHIFGRPSLVDATHALGSIVFAYGGVPAFFTVVAEMREPKKFHRVVLFCQGFTTGTYLLVGLVIYIFCGDVVLSPALKSAGPVFKKVCYSLASPAIIIGSIIYLHLAAKYIFVRVLRGGPHLTTNSVKHWVTWISSVTACLVVAFFVAQAVSVSEHLVGFVGALFGSLMSINIMGMMWLYDNLHRRHCEQTWRFRGLVAWNIFMIVGGLFICIAGTYGSVALMIVAHRGKALPIFRCSDNSI